MILIIMKQIDKNSRYSKLKKEIKELKNKQYSLEIKQEIKELKEKMKKLSDAAKYYKIAINHLSEFNNTDIPKLI